MARFLYNTATSLDGFIADPQNSLDWLFAVPSAGTEAEHEAFVDPVTVLVEGSTTYQWVLDHENLLEHPERWAAFYGGRPTFVFTSRDLPRPEGADMRFVRGPVAEALPAIREAAGAGDVWIVGGGGLAAQFLEAGALDRIIVSVAPVTLGTGAALFPTRLGSDRLVLRTVAAIDQFAQLTYDVVPAGPR